MPGKSVRWACESVHTYSGCFFPKTVYGARERRRCSIMIALACSEFLDWRTRVGHQLQAIELEAHSVDRPIRVCSSIFVFYNDIIGPLCTAGGVLAVTPLLLGV